MKKTIPNRWNAKPLNGFGQIVCGKTPSKTHKEFFNGGIPFIKIPDMHDKPFVIYTEDSLTKLGEKSQLSKTLSVGSICVSCIATVGLVSIITTKSQTNQQINSIIPYADSFRFYLFYAIKSIKQKLKDIGSSGSATLNVNTGTFSKIEILFPDPIILSLFNDNVEPIFSKILSNMNQIQSLSKIRDSLLPKLMSGKIRV